MPKINILILENDNLELNNIINTLNKNSYIVHRCASNSHFLDLIYEHLYDLYLISLNDSFSKEFELMELLNEYEDLTMKMVIASIPKMIKPSFFYGCDECVIKNVDEKEILFRIKALIRRQYNIYKDEINIRKNIKYNIFEKNLYINNEIIIIGEKPLLILDYLLKFKNSYVSLESLEKGVYPANCDSKNGVIRFHIYKLRQILGEDIIVSNRTNGYKIEC